MGIEVYGNLVEAVQVPTPGSDMNRARLAMAVILLSIGIGMLSDKEASYLVRALGGT